MKDKLRININNIFYNPQEKYYTVDFRRENKEDMRVRYYVNEKGIELMKDLTDELFNRTYRRLVYSILYVEIMTQQRMLRDDEFNRVLFRAKKIFIDETKKK